MTNKIKITQEAGQERRIPVTQKIAQKLARGAMYGAGIGLSGAILGFVGNELYKAHEYEPYGEQTVLVEPGDTTQGLIDEFVDKGSNHLNEATEAVKEMNPDVNIGQLPVGVELKLPEGMEDK